VGGLSAHNGSIQAGVIGSIRIAGDVQGNAGQNVFIVAEGKTGEKAGSSPAIRSIRVDGDLAFAQILGGFTVDEDGASNIATLGTIEVGGQWHNSSIIAGATTSSGIWGDGGNYLSAEGIVRSISKIIINGDVSSDETTGIVAEKVKSLKINGQVIDTSEPYRKLADNFYLEIVEPYAD
jgi:hypothetical protein